MRSACTSVRVHLLYGLALLASAIFAVQADASQLDESVSFDIPAQPLENALFELSKQSAYQIVFSSGSLPNRKVSAVSGRMQVKQALGLLLAGTELGYKLIGERTITVGPGKSSTEISDAGSVGNVHLAQVDAKHTAETNTSPAGSSTEDSENKNEMLEEVVVTAQYKFLNVDTSGTTNLPLPIEKVPQSISLVSGDFIKAANLKTLGEIAEYTPGAINRGNEEALGSLIMLRGFSAGRAVDGLNFGGIPLYEPDYAILDRLEVVKGPSSVVYGVSSPGGLVNSVTKSATRETTDYLYAQGGNWNNYRIEGQIAGALDSEGHARAIGVAVQDQGDSFLNEVYHKKTTLYAGINVDLSDSITAFLHGGYERLERTSFDGNPTEPDGSPAPVARSFCNCSKNIAPTTSVYHAEGDLTWHATDMLEFSVKGNYESAHITGNGDYAFGLAPNGDIGLGVYQYTRDYSDNYGIGASSTYQLDALGLKKSFVSLAGLYQRSSNYTSASFGGGAANIFDGQAAISQAFDSLVAGPLFPFFQLAKAKTLTVSTQSMLQLTDPLGLLLGVSYSKPDVSVQTGSPPAQDFNIKSQISYRGGLIYEFLPRTNAYVSFSQSFSPQLLIARDGSVLPPLIGEQYEGGLKYRSADGRLLLTGAVFQIREKNVGQFDEQISPVLIYSKPVGEVTHKGTEFQALGQLTRQWQINAGYTYLDPKVTADSDPATVGQTELFLPKQSLSLYTTYTLQHGILPGLSFGGGARYVSSMRTSFDGSTKDLPGYPLVDATLGYAADKWLVQLNVRNIFDRRYFINNYPTLFYGTLPGDPTNVALTVRRTF